MLIIVFRFTFASTKPLNNFSVSICLSMVGVDSEPGASSEHLSKCAWMTCVLNSLCWGSLACRYLMALFLWKREDKDMSSALHRFGWSFAISQGEMIKLWRAKHTTVLIGVCGRRTKRLGCLSLSEVHMSWAINQRSPVGYVGLISSSVLVG